MRKKGWINEKYANPQSPMETRIKYNLFSNTFFTQEKKIYKFAIRNFFVFIVPSVHDRDRDAHDFPPTPVPVHSPQIRPAPPYPLRQT